MLSRPRSASSCPVLKDADEIASTFGQLVIAAASIADFGGVILLSLFFSRESTATAVEAHPARRLFVRRGASSALAHRGRRALAWLSDVLRRLQDTTAQIRVRGAFVLLIGFVALAENVGLEVILGAFIAGAILSLIDRDRAMTHPAFRRKLEAAGFGIFIPVFFVDHRRALRPRRAVRQRRLSPSHVPLFLLALLLVRGLPALLYRRSARARRRPSSRAHAGDVAAVHRRRDRRSGSTLDVVDDGQRGGADRGRPAVGRDLPRVSLALLRRGRTDGAGQPVGDDRIVAAPGA